MAKHKLEKICWFCKGEIPAYQWNRLKLDLQKRYLLIPNDRRTFSYITIQPYHWNFAHAECLDISSRQIEQFAKEIEEQTLKQQQDEQAAQCKQLKGYFGMTATEQADYRRKYGL